MELRSAIAEAGKKFRKRNITKRMQSIIISPIKEMPIIAEEIKKKTSEKIISFGQGIPHFDTPDHIKDAIRNALSEIDTAKYSLEPGMPRLQDLIARKLEKRKGIEKISPHQIFVSVGCQEAMSCAIFTVAEKGDEVILPEPCFASHIVQVMEAGATPVFVPLKDGWKLDIEGIKKAVTKRTKAIIITTPSNPTGAVFPEKDIREIAEIAIEKDLIILTDETYDYLVYDNIRHFSPASIPEIKDRVILCGSFSKEYALTGYRVGFAYAEEGLVDQMLKMHDAVNICCPVISQKAAIAALQGSQDCVADFVKKLSVNREMMCRELDTLSDIFEYHKPEGAYYIFVKVRPDVDSMKLALKILNEAKVIVIPGMAFGPSGEGYIRFSFAGKPEEITEGFERLRKWAINWKKEGYSLKFESVY